MQFEEQKRRSILKVITHRLLIIGATATITWLVTKNFDMTVGITLTSAVVNTTLYYLHERIWNMVSWGRVKENKKNLTEKV